MRKNEISVDEMRSAIEDKLCAYFSVTSENATREQVFQASAMVIRELMSRLNPRQQQILRLHFGMEDGVCYSLEEIGRKLGVSKERVRQIERQAMDKLQKDGESLGLEDFLNE